MMSTPSPTKHDRHADQLRQRFNDLAGMPLSFRAASYRFDMIYCGTIPPRWWRNYLHEHSFFEACYAYRGRGTFRILEDERRVKAGDLFIARPREHHEVISSRHSPLGIYFWAFGLAQTSTRAVAPADEALDLLIKAFVETGQPVARLGPHFERTLLQIADEVAAREPGVTQSVQALSLKLLIDTARSVIDTSQIQLPAPPPKTNGAADTVQIVMRYLQDNFAQRTEVRDVASQVHLSERHISRLFRQATGLSILAYLTQLRIETACKLLAEDELSIKQVARAVGYPDSHYFTTLFGRHVGVTPAAYRRSGGAARSASSSQQRS